MRLNAQKKNLQQLSKRLSAPRSIERMCTGCRKSFDRDSLYRIVHNRSLNTVQLFELNSDKPAQTQGRSSYICKQPECVLVVLKGKKLQKSLKTALPDGIVSILEGFLKTKET